MAKKGNASPENLGEGTESGTHVPETTIRGAVQEAPPPTPPSNDGEQKTAENQSGVRADNGEKENAVESAKVAGEGKTTAVEKEGDNAQRSEVERIAKEVFKNYPGKNTLYFTSDKIPFFDKNDADRHSLNLKNQIVVAVENK
jgi:hypothetical protein